MRQSMKSQSVFVCLVDVDSAIIAKVHEARTEWVSWGGFKLLRYNGTWEEIVSSPKSADMQYYGAATKTVFNCRTTLFRSTWESCDLRIYHKT